MCLLTFIPAGIMPDYDNLREGACSNPDGSGYAIIINDRILIGRGLDSEVVIDRFKTIRTKHPEGPALFHSRITTHGLTDKSNCHPFPLRKDPMSVMGHNGILPCQARLPKHDQRSDTRFAAEEIIGSRHFSHLHEKGRKRIEQWMGDNNKIVILTLNPRIPEKYIILNEKAGNWDNGIWYSNRSYISYKSYSNLGYIFGHNTLGYTRFDPKTGITTYLRSNLTDCRVCFSNNTVRPEIGVCQFCHSCIDCAENVSDCLCYIPSNIRPSVKKEITDKPHGCD